MGTSNLVDSLGFPPMENVEEVSISKTMAIIACTSMSILYVAILYSPTLILRLPNPSTLNSFMIRRFICAAVSSVVSIFLCAFLLIPMGKWGLSSLFGLYGIRADHMWNAVVYPLCLTSLLYIGSFFTMLLSPKKSRKEDNENADLFWCLKNFIWGFLEGMTSLTSNVLAWRNYVVAPLTEEVVFRACMIPLLLCGGLKPYTIIFFSPIFFSLAHLNHFLELYFQQNYTFLKASLIVGLQLGYTVLFGSYASFLYIRTGHLIAPVVAHVICNIMGLPMLSSQRKGLSIAATVAGFLGFIWFLFPATNSSLYNYRTDNCLCWHGYCTLS
ncbi:CAAX prenyl protease 2-like [Papaver somniferum]|uniref:CAAX prenyl protease 2-like n=1 Tax=Papaver somniferum TaxID=3469 RepID=UPI000E704D96|nr:CAAX prenyl protease 2-like [Papaver somniferum]